MSDNAKTAIRDLMVANRILSNEGVVDAFGHISVRNPGNAGRYFLACSRPSVWSPRKTSSGSTTRIARSTRSASFMAAFTRRGPM